MKNVIVFGGGQQGNLIAQDLVERGYNVTIADIVRRNNDIPFVDIDVSSEHFKTTVFHDLDLIVCALPAELGERCVRQAVLSGVDCVDVSFTELNYKETEINDLANKCNCIVLADCGLAPGLPNLMIGDMLRERGSLDQAGFYVGGISALEDKNYLGYVPSWSIKDLCSEYTRPARIAVNGKIVTLPPPLYHTTYDLEILKTTFGDFEAFYSDGVRSLLQLRDRIPTIIEKTLRWPGHIKKIQEITQVSGDNYDIEKLEKAYNNLERSNNDLVVLRVFGEKYYKDITCPDYHKVYDMVVYGTLHGDHKNTAMSQTTGHSCSGFASLLLENYVNYKGVFYPEDIGLKTKEALNHMINWLSSYDIKIQNKTYNINKAFPQ